MNDTSATSASGASLTPSTTDVFTAAHLGLIAILIVLTIVAIGYGMRLARRRHVAAREIDAHNADVEAGPPATPAAVAEAPVSAAVSGADDGTGPVTQLKGLGPKVAARLGELGVTTVGQLAALDEAGAARLDNQLGPFSGRMARDRWIEQARLLAAGDRAGFEAAFGRL